MSDTTADKLSLLNTSKKDIRGAINNRLSAQSIVMPEETPLSEYDVYIKMIQGGDYYTVASVEDLSTITNPRTNALAVVYDKTHNSNFVDVYIYQDNQWKPVPNVYTATANKILSGETALGALGPIEGSMPNNGTLTITPTTSQQSIPAGYISGGTVEAVTASVDPNIVQSNIKAGVTILGVQGNVEPDKPDQTKTATPTTSQQIIEPDTGYELASVTVNGVTSDVDANIVPENIKSGTTILGVTGSLPDTSDATATSADMLAPKTAYVNGSKITGTIISEYKDDSTPEFGNIILTNNTNYTVLDINYIDNVALVKVSNTQIKVCKIINNTIVTTSAVTFNTTDFATIGNQNRLIDSKFLYDNNTNEFAICGIIWVNYTPWISRFFSFVQYLNKTTLATSTKLTLQVEMGTDGTVPSGVILPRPHHPECFAFYMLFGNNGNQHGLLNFYISNNTIHWASIFVTNWENHGSVRIGKWTAEGTKLYITDTINTYYVYSVSIDNTVWTRIYSNTVIPLTDVIGITSGTSTYDMTINSVIGTSDISLTQTTLNWVVYEDWLFIINSNNVKAYKIDGNAVIYKLTYGTTVTSIIGCFDRVWANYGNTFYSIDAATPVQVLYKITRNGIKYYSTNDSTGVAEDLIDGKVMYNNYGKIYGSIPNNGYLTYSPSSQYQSIPAGYTTGGVVNAAAIEDTSEYNDCLTLSRSILGGDHILHYQLEYIRSTGTQYIDTNITATNDVDIEVTFKCSDTSPNYMRLYGDQTSGSYTVYMRDTSVTSWCFNSGDAVTINATTSYRTIKYLGSTGQVYLDNAYLSTATRSGNTGRKLWLFRGGDRYSKFNLQKCRIWASGTLVRDFIPVKRTSDNVVCLYDKVSGTYFTNIGTGTFTAGPIVS